MSACPAAAPSRCLSRKSANREAETLAEVNAERAARRPVIVVTDTANGEQRLVKAKDIATDPLRADLTKQLRMGKSGMIEAGGKKLFLNVYAPTASSSSSARSISARHWRRWHARSTMT